MTTNTTTNHESTDAELLTDDAETAQAFRRLLGGSVDLAADSVRDAFDRSEDPEEMARRFRKAEEEIRLLAEFAETLAEREADE